MTSTSFPKKLNFLDQTNETTMHDIGEKVSFEQNSLDPKESATGAAETTNNSNVASVKAESEKKKLDNYHYHNHHHRAHVDDEEEVLQDLEGEDEEDNDDVDAENEFAMRETDYFKIIDQKLEIEKLKRKQKQSSMLTNGKFDNFRAKSGQAAAAWEISPTKYTPQKTLHFNKYNETGTSRKDSDNDENDAEHQERLFTYHRYK